MIFARLFSPRFRALNTFKPSSIKPDQRGEHDGEHDDGAASRELVAPDDVGEQPTERCRSDDGEPAHRRRAGLGAVTLGAFLADGLADLALAEELDQEAGADQGHGHGDGRGHEHADHSPTSGRLVELLARDDAIVERRRRRRRSSGSARGPCPR